MAFFVILEILLVGARIAVTFFEAVPVAAQDALTWACVVVGIIAVIFIFVRIYRDITRK